MEASEVGIGGVAVEGDEEEVGGMGFIGGEGGGEEGSLSGGGATGLRRGPSAFEHLMTEDLTENLKKEEGEEEELEDEKDGNLMEENEVATDIFLLFDLSLSLFSSLILG